MGVTPGKKSSKKGKSPKVDTPTESTPKSINGGKSAEKKTPKAETLLSPANSSNIKSDSSKKRKNLKRRLGDEDYAEDVKSEEKMEVEETTDKHETNGDVRFLVSGLGLENMSGEDLCGYFKTHGHSVENTKKKNESRHAVISFSTKEAGQAAKDAMDKKDCKGFPLSIESQKELYTVFKMLKHKGSEKGSEKNTIKVEEDCMLYISPVSTDISKSVLLSTFPGVKSIHARRSKTGTRNWIRLNCKSSDVAKKLLETCQGVLVGGVNLKVENVIQFRKRTVTEENEKQKESAKKIKAGKQASEQLQDKKKQSPAQKATSKDDSDSSDASDDESSDASSSEDDQPQKAKKTKLAKRQ